MGMEGGPQPGNEPTADQPPQLRGRPDRVPERIGGFRIRRLIASGGMGLVYEAVQESPHRAVALKVMRRSAATPAALRRFRNEAELMAKLRHPGIAQVYEAGIDESGPEPVPFIAMELISGAKTLREFVRARNLPREQMIELVAEAADAVAHGNSKGIIHRDLKPSNILVDQDGKVKIVDFGVARTMDADAPMTQQTELGQLVGTVQYMSPEQIAADSRELDARADVYSLGVILYELVSGRLPHDLEGKSVYEAAVVIRDQPSHKLSTVSTDVPLDLGTIVHRAVERDRDRRYATAADLAADLRRFLGGQPIAARRDSWWYVFTTSSRAWIRANKALYVLVAVCVAAAVAFWGGTWLTFRATQFSKIGEYPVIGATPALIDRLDHTALIVMPQGFDPEAVAEKAGVQGVDRNQVRSMRRVHGELMKRLAQASPRAVVFNISFTNPAPEHDGLFLEGVESLAAKNIPVITALDTYTPRTPEWYAGASSIVRHPNVYAGEMILAPTSPESAHLELPSYNIGMRRGDAETLISGPLYAWALARRPGSGLRAEISFQEDFLELMWFDRDRQGRTLEQVQMRERVPTSFMRIYRSLPGLPSPTQEREGDISAFRSIETPLLAQMESATIAYQDAMEMDLAALASRVSGKIVVIGNDTIRPDGAPADSRSYSRHGEVVPGSRLVASTIEGLCRGVYVNFVGFYSALLITLVCSAVGALIAAKIAAWKNSGTLAVLAAMVGTAVAVTLYAVLICRLYGLVINPVVPTISGLLGGLAMLPVVLRHRNRQRVVTEVSRGRST
jgi:hypothetical protein